MPLHSYHSHWFPAISPPHSVLKWLFLQFCIATDDDDCIVVKTFGSVLNSWLVKSGDRWTCLYLATQDSSHTGSICLCWWYWSCLWLRRFEGVRQASRAAYHTCLASSGCCKSWMGILSILALWLPNLKSLSLKGHCLEVADWAILMYQITRSSLTDKVD